MRKFLLSIVLVFTLSVAANAQTDGFFEWNSNIDYSGRESGIVFYLPIAHGTINDYPSTPLGSGMVIFAALGAVYAVIRKKRQ